MSKASLEEFKLSLWLECADINFPAWTGFNTQRAKLLLKEPQQLTTITYLPVINAVISDMSTINHILEKGVSAAEQLLLPGIVMVFDEAVYCKIQMVRWANEVYRSKIVPRLGDFHTVMSYLSAIGKLFKDAGLQLSLIHI